MNVVLVEKSAPRSVHEHACRPVGGYQGDGEIADIRVLELKPDADVIDQQACACRHRDGVRYRAGGDRTIKRPMAHCLGIDCGEVRGGPERQLG